MSAQTVFLQVRTLSLASHSLSISSGVAKLLPEHWLQQQLRLDVICHGVMRVKVVTALCCGVLCSAGKQQH